MSSSFNKLFRNIIFTLISFFGTCVFVPIFNIFFEFWFYQCLLNKLDDYKVFLSLLPRPLTFFDPILVTVFLFPRIFFSLFMHSIACSYLLHQVKQWGGVSLLRTTNVGESYKNNNEQFTSYCHDNGIFKRCDLGTWFLLEKLIDMSRNFPIFCLIKNHNVTFVMNYEQQGYP